MMRSQFIQWSFGALVLLTTCAVVTGKESDQYTVPPQPLVDVGGEVQQIVTSELERIVEETNEKLAMHRSRADGLPPGEAREWNKDLVAELLSREYIAEQLHDALGEGFPESKIELNIRARYGDDDSAIFELSCDQSVFCKSIAARPLIGIGVVPTINCHGAYFGTDKLGHLFQQGYEYLREYERSLHRNGDRAEAVRKAVSHGVLQERSVYGYLPSGVYSNADLAANLAGLMLYINLTEAVEFGSRRLPPILIATRESGWQFNPESDGPFLRPFLSHHFNEAMNPAEYDWALREGIRGQIEQRIDAWLDFHKTTPEREQQRYRGMALWHGVEYGHSGFDDLILIAEVARSDSRRDDIAMTPRAGVNPSHDAEIAAIGRPQCTE